MTPAANVLFLDARFQKYVFGAMQLIWELIFSKGEKRSPESTYSVLNSVSIENGPCHSNLQFCVFHFNLSYTVASVLSFWEQTFFTGIGKIMECVQMLLQVIWVT